MIHVAWTPVWPWIGGPSLSSPRLARQTTIA